VTVIEHSVAFLHGQSFEHFRLRNKFFAAITADPAHQTLRTTHQDRARNEKRINTHVTETADVWTSRVPARMRDAVPHVDTDAQGRQWWVLGDKRLASPGLSATAGVGAMKHWPKNYD
jgi:hypothetical protein